MTAIRSYLGLSDDAKELYDQLKYGHETYCAILQYAVDNGLGPVVAVPPGPPDFDWDEGVEITPYDFSSDFTSINPNLTYSMSNGTPAGLTLDPDTGILTGTPTAISGGSKFITASDGISQASHQFDWVVGTP